MIMGLQKPKETPDFSGYIANSVRRFHRIDGAKRIRQIDAFRNFY